MTTMQKSGLLLLTFIALVVVGCGAKTESAAQAQPSAAASASTRKYEMHGKVISVNAGEKSARIDAAEVKGWMSAMTMDYPVRDAADIAKLMADKSIDATIFVDGDNFWIGEIRDAAPTAAVEHKK